MVHAVSRAIRATTCSNCRASLLRSFTSIAGVQWQPSATQNRSWRTPVPARTVRYSSNTAESPKKSIDEASTTVNVAEAIPRASQPIESNREHGSYTAKPIAEPKATLEEAPLLVEDAAVESKSSSTPWYLQVESPPSAHIPALSKRHIIPDLPDNPPAILQPLLQRISVDLGLDDLTLLDLRELDPPPALGSNLIMLIGTARSEKHLHVSADRLCRWLRTEYKLRPDADGLLGRNELKLKLKRKAKRAKLMGTLPHEDDADDGVRTGWVCVNVGTVESADRGTTEPDKEFVGFGRQTDGTKIVVQMLVEEKRIELDLERLWGGIVKRQASGLPADVDTDDSVEVTEDPASQAQTQTLNSSPVVKVHDAYAEPFPTTSSFSPVTVQPRNGRNASKPF